MSSTRAGSMVRAFTSFHLHRLRHLVGAVPRADVIRRVLDRVEPVDIAFAEPKIEDVVRVVCSRGAREGA